MATHDLGHTLTDKKLRDLERRIARLYAQAGRELQETIDAYFEQFAKRDEEMRALIGEIVNGKEWTEQDYKQWRLAQIGRGEHYQALRERIAQRMTNANDVAISYINDETPGIYSLNRNYAAYTIEQVAGNVGFDLWDEQTARRLIVEQPELMPNYPPARALRRGIDLAYGRRQITASVTSSILQGRSLRGIADDLQQRITTMDRTSAIRTARTAFTGAQNAGRMDSYAAAEKMGIKLKKEWLATLDSRTRHSHAMLDGEKVDQDKKFSNGCRFPGDPQGPAWEIYNCRCTMVAALDDVDTSDAQRRARDPETGESVVISDMTYQEWANWKSATAQAKNAADDAAALKFFHADARDDLQSIVKKRTMKLENGFACFPDNDPLQRYIQSVKPLKTYFDVAMHGAPNAVGFGTAETNMSPRLLASVIRHSAGWNGQKVRLLSCSTGKQVGDDYCFAEELANALGVEVKAPDDILLISPSGRMSVGLLGKGSMVSYIPNQRGRRK